MSNFLWLGVGAGRFLEFSTGFFWTANSIFLVLFYGAWRAIRGRLKSSEDLARRIGELARNGSAPPVSVIIPAHNEERVVIDSVAAYLDMDYPALEVIVVNDGSQDATLARLVKHYELVAEENSARRSALSAAAPRAIYRSLKAPRLRVIDKANSGKADSLNLAIDYARHPLFCAADADSIPEHDAIARSVIPFLDRPETIACGGSIRVFNGSRLEGGRVREPAYPSSWVGSFQVIEYARAFFCARVGWDLFNANVLVPGAFGVFRRDAVVGVGGYAADSASEDLELIVRMHRAFREADREYRISFIPDPVCWTLVPESLRALYEQRRRWQRGMVETLFSHLDLFLNPKYGAVGLFAFPYQLIVEVIGPVIEAVTYVCFIAAYFFGFLDLTNFLIFLGVSFGYGTLLTLASLWLERRYTVGERRAIAPAIFLAVLENFGWRQLLAGWRAYSLFASIRVETSWRKSPRSAGLTNDG